MHAIDAVAPQQSACAGADGFGHFERCQHLSVAHQPGHGLSFDDRYPRHTLKRISITSPSDAMTQVW